MLKVKNKLSPSEFITNVSVKIRPMPATGKHTISKTTSPTKSES